MRNSFISFFAVGLLHTSCGHGQVHDRNQAEPGKGHGASRGLVPQASPSPPVRVPSMALIRDSSTARASRCTLPRQPSAMGSSLGATSRRFARVVRCAACPLWQIDLGLAAWFAKQLSLSLRLPGCFAWMEPFGGSAIVHQATRRRSRHCLLVVVVTTYYYAIGFAD